MDQIKLYDMHPGGNTISLVANLIKLVMLFFNQELYDVERQAKIQMSGKCLSKGIVLVELKLVITWSLEDLKNTPVNDLKMRIKQYPIVLI